MLPLAIAVALAEEPLKVPPDFRITYDSLAVVPVTPPRLQAQSQEAALGAAEKEIERPDGLGYESYARVVIEQSGFYDDVFKETNVSWRKTKKGFDEMCVRYPDSPQILNIYCRLACFAGDREQARKLFALIGEVPTSGCWRKKGNEFQRAKNWAMSEK